MKILSLALFFVLVRGNAAAQEVQVPFDSAGTIQVINQDLEKKLDLFPSYANFLEARLYREPDTSYIIEITSFENGQLVKDRLPKSASAVRSLREDVDARLGPQASTVKLNQVSRSKFVLWETLFSIFGYGPAIISSVAWNNGAIGSGVELIIGGSGYLLSSLLTENAAMTDGDASLALGGAFLGAAHGALLDDFLSKGNPGREMGAFTSLISVTETGIGYAIASKNNMTEGTADVIRYGGLFGIWDGAGLALIINNSPSPSLWTGLSLAGSAAGLAAGAIMANEDPYSRGNASAVLSGGVFGPVIPLVIYGSTISYNTSKAPTTGLALAGVAGNIGGVALASSLMHNRNLSTAEGTAVILGTSAGFLIGLGVGIILTSNSRFDNFPWALSLPIAIGTAAGFGITVVTIGKGTGDKPSTGWNFDANPGALMGALMPQHRTGAPISIPAFSARCDF